MNGVRATVDFDTNVEHPKMKGVVDGYNAGHKFEWADFETSGTHYYGDGRRHYAGETIKVVIAFPFWRYFGSKVSVGDRFEIFEGSRLVGHGVVEETVSDVCGTPERVAK